MDSGRDGSRRAMENWRVGRSDTTWSHHRPKFESFNLLSIIQVSPNRTLDTTEITHHHDRSTLCHSFFDCISYAKAQGSVSIMYTDDMCYASRLCITTWYTDPSTLCHRVYIVYLFVYVTLLELKESRKIANVSIAISRFGGNYEY